MTETHIVIAGAGFAGLQAVKKFGNVKGIKVTLIDRTNHHLFQPLLYQVASSVLSPADIAIPIRSLTTDMKNVQVVMGEIIDINKEHKKVSLAHTTISYDYLILAMGARTSYFGHSEWEKYTVGLKNLSDALKIRSKILISFEKAELEANPERARALMSYTVIGGGPTGVEMAGAIAELSHQIIRSDFRFIDP
ncbi:MAG TPA: FAD-dependent oxidoreductase, partial [Leptospiraceae bacterium]|nr:FAD-dependent oxidoreductase [Leptospiraceae bacterium]